MFKNLYTYLLVIVHLKRLYRLSDILQPRRQSIEYFWHVNTEKRSSKRKIRAIMLSNGFWISYYSKRKAKKIEQKRLGHKSSGAALAEMYWNTVITIVAFRRE